MLIPCRKKFARLVAPLAVASAPLSLWAEDPEEDPEQTWIDSSQASLVQTADDLANWLDGFFGTAETDTDEEAKSRIRLRPEFVWDEADGEDWKLRANGRLWLPNLDERLSLVFFSDEDRDEEDLYDPAATSDGDSAVGLEYEVGRDERSQLNLIAAAKSGPKAKLGARYRYILPFGEKNRLNFREELFWVGGDGFGSLTRMDVDRSIDDQTILRWANRAEYTEESEGVEWNSRLAWVRRLNDESAFRAFGFIRGETDPGLVKSRGFGMVYRRKLYRDWIFWEVEPRYSWRKRQPEDEREGVAELRLRLDIVLSKDS